VRPGSDYSVFSIKYFKRLHMCRTSLSSLSCLLPLCHHRPSKHGELRSLHVPSSLILLLLLFTPVPLCTTERRSSPKSLCRRQCAKELRYLCGYSRAKAMSFDLSWCVVLREGNHWPQRAGERSLFISTVLCSGDQEYRELGLWETYMMLCFYFFKR
jgi:hypothetical protein